MRSPLGCPGARAGAAWRARSGGGARPGGGGGATAAPPEAKFEKGTWFPPFFKPKNKTFSTISPASLSLPGPSPLPIFEGEPRSAWASRCNDGSALPLAPRRRIPGPLAGRLAPRCGRAAAPRASRGAPQADTAPCWRVPVSLRRRSRPAGSALPARRLAPGGGCRPPLPRLSSRRVFCSPRGGSAHTGGSRALRRRLVSSRERSVLLPLLKRATPGAGSAGSAAGLGPLPPPVPERCRLRPALGARVGGGRAFKNPLYSPPCPPPVPATGALPAAGRGAPAPGRHAGRPRLCQTLSG